MVVPTYRFLFMRAVNETRRIVLAHTWKDLGLKILSTSVLIAVAYGFIRVTPAEDDFVFTDIVTWAILALAAATILVMAVFLVQLFFVAPFQLWKAEWERAEQLEASIPKSTFREPPPRDATLAAGLVYALNGSWDVPVLNALMNDANNDGFNFRKREFERDAKAGQLTVWGKECYKGIYSSDGWDLIEPGFWEKNIVSWDNMILGDTARTKSRAEFSSDDQYEDLMVNRAEFEKRWPHG